VSLDRDRLAELADVLIPAEGGMPSASEAGAVAHWLDAVLAARPDFEAPLAGVAASSFDVASLPEHDPAGWTALTAAVVAAYYMNPEVCERLGYAGQRAIPLPAEPDYADLLDSVRARAPVYRPTP
jgi:hypothetical protein